MEKCIDVLCINCEDMITYDKIQQHSKVCVYPAQFVIKLESKELLFIDFKIDKLKCMMEAIVFSGVKPISPKQEEVFQYLIRKSFELLRLKKTTQENINVSKSIAYEIQKYTAQTELDFLILVYSERLKRLATEKANFMMQPLKKAKPELKQTVHQRIQEVNSEVGDFLSNRSMQSKASTLTSPKYNSGLDLEETLKQFSFHCDSEEDTQRLFYSKCLSVKLGFSSRHPAQLIQVKDVYSKAMGLKVPKESWETFIKEEFSHPERWVSGFSK